MEGNVNDPSSYEPVAFGKVDSTTEADKYNIQQMNPVDSLQAELGIDLMLKTPEDSVAILNRYKPLLDSAKKRMGAFTGYRLYHRYRSKNKLGALVLEEGSFYLDSSFQVTNFISSDDSTEVRLGGKY
jgi:hypothetical protein